MFSLLRRPIKLGMIGLGKIAVDQHLPAIKANSRFRLVAGAAPGPKPRGISGYESFSEMLTAHPDIEAVSICTPPQVRYDLAVEAIRNGKHVFLEKPPSATLGEAQALVDLARTHGVTLLASWHSRFAPAVAVAQAWIKGRALHSIHIVWKEDVRHWHPGQRWIFEAGGMGVFDPGINALSILTALLPERVIVDAATLHIPGNCDAPIRVEMDMSSAVVSTIRADFDFLQTGTQTWSIFIDAVDGGKLVLSAGGAALEIDGVKAALPEEAEYAALYAHFARLVRKQQSDADLAPLRVVTDAMLVGRRVPAPDYIE